ncbi:XRE family transcriptional regulator [Mastigocladus laminosus UU774]|nr:XRE family transcriptional regulator [Mastigocladus laminosus UU774]
MPKRDKDQQEAVSPLRQLREQAGLTQEQFAYRLGVAVSTVRRWEKGKEPSMTLSEWRKFCRLVNKDFGELPELLSSQTEAS